MLSLGSSDQLHMVIAIPEPELDSLTVGPHPTALSLSTQSSLHGGEVPALHNCYIVLRKR